VRGNGGKELEYPIDRGIKGVLSSCSGFFAIGSGLVEPMFYGFDILVAETVPSEFSNFVSGHVELTIF